MYTSSMTQTSKATAEKIAARYNRAVAAQDEFGAQRALAQYGRLVKRLGCDPLA